eukprot:Sspe_Gene.83904::Locus_55050_Transcript_1_1_Confidence_1.000_Length_979::g.83904::m.83904/K12876/RBM8A, Y14; RNA-binding protein 8A
MAAPAVVQRPGVSEFAERGQAMSPKLSEGPPLMQRPTKSEEGWVVFVAGVHEEATEDDLVDVFGEFGAVRTVHLNLDRRTCFAMGYAFVEYADYAEAAAAVRGVDGQHYMGRTLAVDWAFVSGP